MNLVTRLVALLLTIWCAAPALAGGDGYEAKKKAASYAWKLKTTELSAEERVKTAELFRELVADSDRAPAQRVLARAECPAECAGCGAGTCTELASMKAFEKVSSFTARPGGWDAIEQDVRAAFASKASPAARSKVLDVLSSLTDEGALACAAELFESHAQSFTTDHLLALVELGDKRFKKALWKRAEQGEVKPAAFFVALGKVDLKPQLVAAIKRTSFERDDPAPALLAAAVLTDYDGGKSWKKACTRTHAAVLTALDEGDLERARDVALTIEFVAEHKKSYGLKQLAWFDELLAWHRGKRAGELTSADQVFELIERLAPAI